MGIPIIEGWVNSFTSCWQILVYFDGVPPITLLPNEAPRVELHFQNIGYMISHILVLLHLTNYNKPLMLSVHQVVLSSNLLCAKCQFCGPFNYYFLAFVVMTVVRK